MNDIQAAKRRMYRRVGDVCLDNEKIYAGNPAFVKTVVMLENNIEAIGKNEKQQSETVSIGVTAEKTRQPKRLSLQA
jgi:hypothetical protein